MNMKDQKRQHFNWRTLYRKIRALCTNEGASDVAKGIIARAVMSEI
jgi:hypothetical protein